MTRLINDIPKNPVVPIPPAFDSSQNLDFDAIERYLNFLSKNDAKTVMTTAGTSQFSLLTKEELFDFNSLCLRAFDGNVIMGLQPSSTRSSILEIEKYNLLTSDRDRHSLILLYPERYYEPVTIVKHFSYLADCSSLPIFIHGMWMRKGSGGTYNYSASLINMLAGRENIIGMKEETDSYSLAYDTLKNCDDSFLRVVAGGSMRRYSLLCNAGANGVNNTTFLSGIGNLFPRIEASFIKKMKSPESVDDFRSAREILTSFEDVLFDIFMSIGWHKALRESLKLDGMPYQGTFDREPFAKTSRQDKKLIKEVVETIQKTLPEELKNEI